MCWSLSMALAPPVPSRSCPQDAASPGGCGVPKGMWGSQGPTSSSHPGSRATTPNLCSHTSPRVSSLPVPWGGFIIVTWHGLDVPWEQHCWGGVHMCVCASRYLCVSTWRECTPVCACVQAGAMCTVYMRWGDAWRVCAHTCAVHACAPCPCRCRLLLGAHAAPAGPPGSA